MAETLTSRRRWVLFDENKVPMQCDGKNASSTNPDTWATYEEVKKALPTTHQAVGVGVVLGDGLCGIDLDHCVKDGVIEPWAQTIINDLDSYTDISPSGTGIEKYFAALGISSIVVMRFVERGR